MTKDRVQEEDQKGEVTKNPENNNVLCRQPTPLMTRTCSCGRVSNEMAELFEDFMQFGSVGLHIVDKDGTILWANNAELELLGYSAEEYIGKPIADFHQDMDKIEHILSVLSTGGKLTNYIAPIRCKDGHTEYMAISSSMRKVNGKYTTTRCFSVCVTDRTTASSEEETNESAQGLTNVPLESCGEQANEEQENPSQEAGTRTREETARTGYAGYTEEQREELAVLFEDFMEFGSIGLHIVDSTGIIRWANRAEMDLLGYTREEYFGKSVTEVYADGAVLQQLLTTLLSGNKLVRAVTPLWAKDGHIEYVEINSSMRKVNGQYLTTRCFSTCITDRVMREKEQAIAIAKEKEVAASREETRRKTDFLRKLCHELRNPLAGVTGNIDLLLSELHQAKHQEFVSPKPLPDAELSTEEKLAQAEKRLAAVESKLKSVQQTIGAAIEYAESAQLAAEHQMLVVNDTLSLSRLESEGFEFSVKPVDVCHVLDSVQAILGVKAQEKSIDFSISKADLLPTQGRYIRTDPVWLKQILINLVSNALKFTDQSQGRVDLVVGVLEESNREDQGNNQTRQGKDDVTLQFRVTDNGIGMTEEERGRLFGVFAQANERISSQFGGSGLGLYIVKQLLDHVGGSISVESQKGLGSSFIVKMPCGALTQEELAGLMTKPKTHLWKAPSQEQHKPSSSRNKNARVLVVDDSSVNRQMIAAFLRKRGYSYQLAENGLVALEMHNKSPFHVILTDVDMPVMDGNELTRHLRQQESKSGNSDSQKTPPVTVIGISGNALPDDISAAKEVGMDEYVSKPFNFQALESLMLKHLEARGADTASL